MILERWHSFKVILGALRIPMDLGGRSDLDLGTQSAARLRTLLKHFILADDLLSWLEAAGAFDLDELMGLRAD